MSRAEDIFQKLVYFGEEAIDDYIVNSQTEELFLDFKRADSTGKNGLALHKDDRRNLAKAISGFGNSEGGVLIWGVECARSTEVGDVAQAKVKVQNVHPSLSPITPPAYDIPDLSFAPPPFFPYPHTESMLSAGSALTYPRNGLFSRHLCS